METINHRYTLLNYGFTYGYGCGYNHVNYAQALEPDRAEGFTRAETPVLYVGTIA